MSAASSAVIVNAVEASVSLDNVTKIFGRFAALRGITAEFQPSRLYVLTGDNGAGKSTLLRIIAGLIKPSSGTVASRGALGYMAHASMLYDELTATENLNYFAQLYGLERAACDRAIETVSLDPKLERRVRDYSQGMRQRLSLARAVLNDPDVLLLDEPFSNVDTQSATQMSALLGQLRERRKTVIVVTHQPELLRLVADEFLKMNVGVISERTPSLTGARA